MKKYLLLMAAVAAFLPLGAQAPDHSGIPDDMYYLLPSFGEGYVYFLGQPPAQGKLNICLYKGNSVVPVSKKNLRKLFPARKDDIDAWFKDGNSIPKDVDGVRALLDGWNRPVTAQIRRQTLKDAGVEREYWVYVPDSLSPSRPLVFMLHGYGRNAEGYFPALQETAKKYGFALCYPQGLKDPGKGKPGWNVGYPSQEGWKQDDIAFMLHLKKHLVKEYKLNPNNAFFAGMSNGGEMCYVMAYQHPEAFSAICSLAGLTMDWLYQTQPKGSVPFMEVHGTADKTSAWEGDLENAGGWGAYRAVPESIGRLVKESGCTDQVSEPLPLYTPESHPVIRHRYTGGKSEIRLYEVTGGKHAFGDKDLDICEEMWAFFTAHLR